MTKPGEVNMVGVALTVKTCYGDNLMIHQGLDMAAEGDVLVIANEEGRNRSLLGEIMYRYAERKNLAGIVLDGPIRDALQISGGSVPLYATGSTPGGPYKEGPGEVNVPVSCGGVHVNPGDIIVGDPDGVIVIPRQDAEDVLEAVKAFQQNDRRKLQAAIDGTADRSWVMKQLEAKKCEFRDGAYRD
jgi:regulator of RNase E activity RraA